MTTISAMPHYPNAPIREAVIDLQVGGTARQEFPEVLAGYPKRRNIVHAETVITVDDEIKSEYQKREVGYAFTSADEKYVAQFRLNGFTLSRLWPYESWEPFNLEAQRLWQVYIDLAQPSEVNRVAVRTINRIDLPESDVSMEKYFRVHPKVPTPRSFTGNSFFMRLNVHVAKIDAELSVTFATIPPQSGATLSVLFDTDIYKQSQLPHDAVWNQVESFHQFRNDFFEECITDESRKLFQ